MKKIRSLAERIIGNAVILVLMASVITAGLGNWISENFVFERSRQVNQLVLDAVTSNANETLVEIEQTINSVLKLPEMDALFEADPDNYYTKTLRKLQIESKLSNIVMYKNFIEGLYISAGNQQIKISNTSLLDFYEFESGPALADIYGMLSSEAKRSFYLYDYQQPYTDFFCIVYPVWGETEPQPDAVVVIMLSRSFVEQLGIHSDSIILSDGIHASAAMPKADSSRVYSAALNWDDWSVIYWLTDENLRSVQHQRLWNSILLVVLLVMLALPASYMFTRHYLAPIRNLSSQIHKIKYLGKNQRIRLRSRGSMRMKLLAFFSATVLVVLVSIIGFFYMETQNLVNQEVGSELEINAELMEKKANLMLSRNRDLMRSIVVDDTVQAYLHDTDYLQEQALEQAMKQFLVANSEILNIALYDIHGKLLYSTSYREALMTESGARDDVSYLMNSNAFSINRVLSQHLFNNVSCRLGMRIISLTPNQNRENLLGFILLDIDMDEPSSSLFQHSAYPEAEVYLLDGNDVDLLVRMHQAGAANIAGMNIEDGASRTTILNRSYYVLLQHIGHTDWRLVITIPWQKYTVQKNMFLFLLLAVFSILLPTIWGIAYLLSRMLVRDVEHLTDTSRKIAAGDFTRRNTNISHTREVGILAQSFNEMLDNLQTATNEKLNSELQAKDAIIHARELELHLLQAQIKPHFLYNTLRTIQFMASQKDPAAVRMLDLLITLFRMGINRNDEMITVEEELKYIKAYVEIQRIRFPDQINMIYDVPDEMLQLPMLKLLLQPIVENAIGHGIRGNGVSGEIRIAGEVTDDSVCFEVRDNGPGMAADKIEKLNQALNSVEQKQSIGLFNVNERVKLCYGKHYGLLLFNNENKGLTVRLVLPRIQGGTDSVE